MQAEGFSRLIMKIFLGICILFIIICIISWIADTHRFVVRYYNINDKRIRKPVRLVLLSDLHNKEYGHGNEKLLAAIRDAKPDAVLIAGDLCNGLKDNDFTPAINLLTELNKEYTVYYGMGNHEYRLKIYPKTYGTMWNDYSQKVDELGLHILDNESVLREENNIRISAVTIDRYFYKRFRKTRLEVSDMEGYLGEADSERFELLIAHNPEYFKAYAEWGADCTVSGHVHGGIMRLPFIGGIVSPRLVEFPHFSNGYYEKYGKKMIVSCGLGTHTIHVRVFNPAELSVIDFNPS